MPAIRARRYARGGGDYYAPPPRRKPPGTPRLATMKLDMVGPAFAMPKLTRKGFAQTMVALAGVVCAAALGAAALGGSFFDVGKATAHTMDGAATAMGFRVDTVEITGALGAREAEVRALLEGDDGHSLLALDPQAVKERIESLDWVAHVSVRLLWPGTLRIAIERRAAVARWQENGHVSVIDAAGERLHGEAAGANDALPLIVGEGAGPAAASLLAAMEDLPALRARTTALVRVGHRRWDVHVASGAVVALPERGPQAALATLERLQDEHRLLDRPVSRIDMRTPGRMSVRIAPELLGGPHDLASASDAGAV
ncbi:MAG: FtsQ-type POTRA domain-containing protein [Alphaproteobacteria bacterium]|nr:FtsQ-type POTRA domain-containing protein [Alphaproteobacteria bacterium]